MRAAYWDPEKSSGAVPQLKGARRFSFEELKKYTNNFSEMNDIGSGGYGKVSSNPFLSLPLTNKCLFRVHPSFGLVYIAGTEAILRG